jgi:hypothetical protein
MALGGLAELVWGVPAEQRPLEEIATPLNAAGMRPGAAAGAARERRLGERETPTPSRGRDAAGRRP